VNKTKGLRRFIAHFDLAVLLFITETNVSLSVYIPERFWTSNNVLELFTDAAGNPDLGCAAYF
jgi:predicted metal-dependent hydrolase